MKTMRISVRTRARGIEQDVAAEHARDRAGGADVGHGRVRADQRLQRRRREPARAGRRATNLTRPIASSTLLPKTQRKSMLPARCSRPPCMNIRGEDGEPRRRLRHRAALRAHLVAPMRELVREDRVVGEVADEVLGLGRAEREAAALPQEVGDDVDRDQRDRDRGEAPGRVVVLEREHGGWAAFPLRVRGLRRERAGARAAPAARAGPRGSSSGPAGRPRCGRSRARTRRPRAP